MGVEAPVDATIIPNSHIEPMSTCLDSLTLISNGEHIKAFLGRFEQDINNEHEASHFYNFVGPSTHIHQFFIPSKNVPLLGHLQTRHNDFIRQLTVSLVVGNPLLRILAAVLMDMQESQVNALTKE